MAIGPVQLLVLGFRDPDFHGEIIDELERLRQSDTVRVIDALAVYKDSGGELTAMHLSNLSEDEAVEVGSLVGALVGLGFDGEAGAEAGAQAGAEAAADGISAFSDEDAWDVLADIPDGSAAALVLLEHHWAVGLRDAVVRAGGYRVSAGFMSPLDLIGLGLLTAEAAELHRVETSAVTTRPADRPLVRPAGHPHAGRTSRHRSESPASRHETPAETRFAQTTTSPSVRHWAMMPSRCDSSMTSP